MRVALEVGRDVGSVKLELILANGKTKKEKLHISISKTIASKGIFLLAVIEYQFTLMLSLNILIVN